MQALKTDSLPLLTRELGIRVVVHDPRSIPIAAEDGVDVRPGDMTSIKLDYVEIHRLGKPWGVCAKDGEVLSYNYSRDPYSQNDCERACVNNEIFRRCHCYHPRFIRSTIIPRRGFICPTNGTAGAEIDDCFVEVMTDNDAGKIDCSCPPACREKDYDIVLSSSKLNSDFFQLVKKSRSLTMKNGTPSVISTDSEHKVNISSKHPDK
ncbi:degenerin mec-4-like [Uloborus diversus]|uniref:degenerin mec-4-like n=1 Tax=Uloborus diversus TaxID=327109 RepID=UPI0024095691|nr:degenerin mec-4-like [Uloborus diversus]